MPIYRSWKNHLRSIAKENQLSIYQTLCILIHKVDRSLFATHMDQFVSYWSSKEPEFIKYFTSYYKDRAGKHIDLEMQTNTTCILWIEKWARCYRHFSHADTDTNMYLERYRINFILQKWMLCNCLAFMLTWRPITWMVKWTVGSIFSLTLY